MDLDDFFDWNNFLFFYLFRYLTRTLCCTGFKMPTSTWCGYSCCCRNITIRVWITSFSYSSPVRSYPRCRGCRWSWLPGWSLMAGLPGTSDFAVPRGPMSRDALLNYWSNIRFSWQGTAKSEVPGNPAWWWVSESISSVRISPDPSMVPIQFVVVVDIAVGDGIKRNAW